MRRLRRATTACATLSAGVALLLSAAPLATPTARAATPDYPAQAADTPTIHWLCAPGIPSDPCGQDGSGLPLGGASNYSTYTDTYSATTSSGPSGLTLNTAQQGSYVQSPNGSTSVVNLSAPAAAPAYDCFYVYPTIDTSPNTQLVPQPDEEDAAFAQVGSLAPLCRIFSPVYAQEDLVSGDNLFQNWENQFTSTSGTDPAFQADVYNALQGAVTPGYNQVNAAWQYYWEHYNIDPKTGLHRGVILLGHSQGAGAVINLMQTYMDNLPAAPSSNPAVAEKQDMRSHLIAAYPLGGNVIVPLTANNTLELDAHNSRANNATPVATDNPANNSETEQYSTFQTIPTCQPKSITGCVVAYSSWEADPVEQELGGPVNYTTTPATSFATLGYIGVPRVVYPIGQFGRFSPSENGTWSSAEPAQSHAIACVNPAALVLGDSNSTPENLDAFVPTTQLFNQNWLGWALTPGYNVPNISYAAIWDDQSSVTAQCVLTVDHGSGITTTTGGFDAGGDNSFLQVSGVSNFVNSPSTSVGLHFVDFSEALGTIIRLSALQEAKWQSTRPSD